MSKAYLFCSIFATYFPSISNSRLTTSQRTSNQRLVQSCVSGMRETERKSSPVSITVRLTQLIVMLPFCMIFVWYCLSKLIERIIDPSSFFSVFRTTHVVSICPVTMCPSMRSQSLSDRSILKKSPIFFTQKLVTRRLSSITKNSYFSLFQFVIVIHAPSCAILCPTTSASSNVFSTMNFHPSRARIFALCSIIQENIIFV